MSCLPQSVFMCICVFLVSGNYTFLNVKPNRVPMNLKDILQALKSTKIAVMEEDVVELVNTFQQIEDSGFNNPVFVTIPVKFEDNDTSR